MNVTGIGATHGANGQNGQNGVNGSFLVEMEKLGSATGTAIVEELEALLMVVVAELTERVAMEVMQTGEWWNWGMWRE